MELIMLARAGGARIISKVNSWRANHLVKAGGPVSLLNGRFRPAIAIRQEKLFRKETRGGLSQGKIRG
ncbi:hypothetical protein Cflav_PD0787 [Pedosphaera parvula Ellin514]|uniref:Uncharacterized protein n=1 Tax=Pedosphaera parvula (strain Ellin514) TaxID=320771 RepID=B9XR29_PEDPL|nr:hypothetical protein Cflav_PD0787 [Pedosphaera parvula Ellin514]